jgi:hypothetical protein
MPTPNSALERTGRQRRATVQNHAGPPFTKTLKVHFGSETDHQRKVANRPGPDVWNPKDRFK